MSGPAVYVPHRASDSHRKASPPRWTSYETNWRVPESLEKLIPVPRSPHPHLRWWLEESNVLPGQPLHPLNYALQIFTDASKEGWGAHLNELTARGTWSPPESSLHINHLELKALFLALNEFKQYSPGGHRQHNSGRGDEVGPSVCSSVENPDLVYQETGNTQSSTHPRPAECDSRQTIKQNGPFTQRSSKPCVPGGTSPKWTCLPPGSTTNFHSLFHRFQTPKHGQWMHSACPGRVWTHMSSHQQPSWAKWWRSCRTTHATEQF